MSNLPPSTGSIRRPAQAPVPPQPNTARLAAAAQASNLGRPAMAIEFYLVSASRRAHRLKIDKPNYVFGRDETCDLVLQDALVSRRHAELRWLADHKCWALSDLGSRNGVFVNGVRITETTRVDDGTQLQVGGQVYRMYFLPPGGDPSSLGAQAPQISTQETMGPGLNFADLATQGATFTGELAGGLLDLLQFFATTGKTGRLDLLGGPGVAGVWFLQGAPIHAVRGPNNGFEALTDLVAAPPPRFAFHADGAPAPQRTLKGSAASILMDVARSVDERAK